MASCVETGRPAGQERVIVDHAHVCFHSGGVESVPLSPDCTGRHVPLSTPPFLSALIVFFPYLTAVDVVNHAITIQAITVMRTDRCEERVF